MSIYDEMFKKNRDDFDEKYELTTGIVKSNYNDKFKGMVKVTMDYFDKDSGESEWMPVATSYAGKGYGNYFLPEVGDQVLIAYVNSDPHSGVVIASLWNTKSPQPEKVINEKNTIKKIITKGGHQIFFDDEEGKGGISVKTKKELTIQMLDEKDLIEIKDKNGDNIISVDSKNGKIEIKAKTEIHINGGTNVPVKIDGSDITIKGNNITLDAKSGTNIKASQIKVEAQTINAKGNASVDVQTSGKLNLKGAITMINS